MFLACASVLPTSTWKIAQRRNCSFETPGADVIVLSSSRVKNRLSDAILLVDRQFVLVAGNGQANLVIPDRKWFLRPFPDPLGELFIQKGA